MEEIKKVVNSYIQSFLHPFRIYQFSHLYTADFENEVQEELPSPLELVDAISVSWLVVLARSLFELILFQVVVLGIGYQGNFTSNVALKAQGYFYVIYIVLSALFFPLKTWLMAKIWTVIISSIGQILEKETSDRDVHAVVAVSQSGHLLRLVPLLGEFLADMGQLFYLIAGLKVKLGFSDVEAVTTVILPGVLAVLSSLIFLGATTLFISVAMF